MAAKSSKANPDAEPKAPSMLAAMVAICNEAGQPIASLDLNSREATFEDGFDPEAGGGRLLSLIAKEGMDGLTSHEDAVNRLNDLQRQLGNRITLLEANLRARDAVIGEMLAAPKLQAMMTNSAEGS